VFVAYAAGVASIAGPHPLLERGGFQLGAALAVALALWLLWRATGMSSALVRLALHPVVSATIVNGGHNDAFVGLAVLAALLLGRTGSPSGGARRRCARQAAGGARGVAARGVGISAGEAPRRQVGASYALRCLKRVRPRGVAFGREAGTGVVSAGPSGTSRCGPAGSPLMGWAGFTPLLTKRAGCRRAVRAAVTPGIPRNSRRRRVATATSAYYSQVRTHNPVRRMVSPRGCAATGFAGLLILVERPAASRTIPAPS
jgi:hypothetical protein